MINVKDNIYIPSEGYKYITDGETYATEIMLGRGQSVDNWHDTNEEPPEPIIEEEATIADYEEALGKLGVE